MSKAPHVIYAIQKVGPSTATRAAFMVLKGFVRQGWQTAIETPATPQNAEIECLWDSVPVYRVPGSSRRQRFLQLAARSPEQRQELIERARKRMLHLFTWEKYFPTLETKFREMASRHK